MKNAWIVKEIETWEDLRAHGKLILNFNDGDVRNIEKQERINKTETKEEGNSSLK